MNITESLRMLAGQTILCDVLLNTLAYKAITRKYTKRGGAQYSINGSFWWPAGDGVVILTGPGGPLKKP